MSRRNWLPDFLKRSRDEAKGDVIAAEVGENARGVAVGKNIIQIGSLQIPIWAIALVVLGVVVVAAVSAYSAVNNKSQFGKILQKVSATPSPTPVPLMTGSFNVAIAQFHVTGQGQGVEIAERLVDDFANQVATTVDELEGILGRVDFRAPAETGQVLGEDAKLRADNARLLAQQINADIVVYGIVTVDGEKAMITPEFYINESVNDGLIEASEITGQYQLGHTLPVDRISNRNLRARAAQQLVARFQALTSIIDGLSAYVVGEYELADSRFEEALAQNAWDNKEVLYVMLGNALLNAGLAKKDTALFEEAKNHYREAIDANTQYARAYVGLAGVLYEQALTGSGATDFAGVVHGLLEECINTYRRALEPEMMRPPLADVESKVHFGLGQAYLLKALLLQGQGEAEAGSAKMAEALQEFQEVVDEYEGGTPESQSRLRERAAHAHARMGLIYRYTRHEAEAEREYDRALAMVPELERTRPDRAKYQAALGDIYLRQGRLQDARSRYEQAIALAPEGSTERDNYQAIMGTIPLQGGGGGNP